MGGLSKKVYQILNLTQAENEERLLLDAGNLLFKRPGISKGPNQERLTAETILDIYKGLNFDAVGIGPLDLSGSVELLQNSSNKGFPWISANLFDAQDKPLFKQWIKRKTGNTEIYITALTANSPTMPTDLKIQATETVLPELITKFKKDTSDPFIILLSTLTNDENRRIAEQYPAINLIIGADNRKSNISPKLIENCLLTQTEKQGKYQGILQITFGTTRQWGQDSAKQLADFQNKLGSLNWQLRRLEKKEKIAGNKDKYKSTILRLNKEKEVINRQMDSAKLTLSQEETNGTTNDQFTYRFIGLKKNMPNDLPTVEKLTLLNQKIRALHKKDKQTKDLSKLTKGMVGHSVCKTCHKTQFEYWKNTRHAKAFTTLEKKTKHLDLNCLPCHLTIDAANKTFQITPNREYLAYPVALQSVGCESCHGPGKKHSTDPETFKIVRRPDPETCLTCHSPDHDDNFDYASKIIRVSCPAQ